MNSFITELKWLNKYQDFLQFAFIISFKPGILIPVSSPMCTLPETISYINICLVSESLYLLNVPFWDSKLNV